MSVKYPAGLWALLSIAVLVIIHLIRHKHEMTAVSSAFLWRLAQQYQKKNRARQRLKRMLLFALQLLAVAAGALMIAQPSVLLPGADTHYVAILDGSSSMQMADGQGQTRFLRACRAVEEDAGRLPWGSRISLILAGDEACLLAEAIGASDLRGALDSAKCGWGKGDLDGAMAIGQQLIREAGASSLCVYTDQEIAAEAPARTVNLASADEWNITIASLSAQGSIHGNLYEATVISRGRDASVAFELYLDGEKQESGQIQLRVNGQIQEGGTVLCRKDEPVSVSVLARQVYDEHDVRLMALAEDGLIEDNEYRLYRSPGKTVRVQLVGENTYFLERVLSVFSQVDLQKAASLREVALKGYDLYVYDSLMPDPMPTDGAIWLINPPYLPGALGVTLGETLRGTALVAERDEESETIRMLTADLTLKNASVVRFREVVSAGRWTSVLRCGSYPVLLADRMESGYARLMMPLRLENTNLPLLGDYVILVRNMLSFSVPPVLPKQDFDSGAKVYPKTHGVCEKQFLQMPDMSVRMLSDTELTEGVCLTVPGGYTLLQEMEEGGERMISFFAHPPLEEGDREKTQAKRLSLDWQRDAESAKANAVQKAELLRVLAGVMLFLLLLEWVVYHREKY